MRNNMSQNIFFFLLILMICSAVQVSPRLRRVLEVSVVYFVELCTRVIPKVSRNVQTRRNSWDNGAFPLVTCRSDFSEREWGGRLPSAVTTQHALNHKSITSSESHQIDFHRRWLLFSYDDNNSHHPTLLMSLALFWLDSPSMWRKLHSVCL